MIKKLLLALTTVGLAVASAADSYRITLFQPSVVNGTTLKPGEYKVELKENKAILKNGKDSVEADVKVESSDQKFPSTSVRYNNGDGKYSIEEIRLGGTKTKLVFSSGDRPAGD